MCSAKWPEWVMWWEPNATTVSLFAAMTPMNYIRALLVKRQEELEQELCIIESMAERCVIEMELRWVEAELSNQKVKL